LKIGKAVNYDLLIYIFLVLQVVSVFFSIAVSSISFALAGLFFILKIASNPRELKSLKTTLDIFFIAFVLVELLSAVFFQL
jgi:hypothetical protein